MGMVSHKRLQVYNKHYIMGCITGSLGCRWNRYQQSANAPNTAAAMCDLIWAVFLLIVCGYTWFWFYYWIIAQNSMADFNWFAYQELGTRYSIYTMLLTLSCITLAYIIIICALALLHIGLGHQLYIHWVHRIILVLILATSCGMTKYINDEFKDGWQLQSLSLMITAPFLHVSGVVMMTFLTGFIIWNSDYSGNTRGAVVVRTVVYVVYAIIMIALYLSPLAFTSPCIAERHALPNKPLLMAHKGASAIAPENTLIAFNYSAAHHVLGFESDVTISYDGIPFVLHDRKLSRTTNVDVVFPELRDTEACWFNITQLRQLNAGSWFIDTDPFGMVGSLSASQRAEFAKQKIPTLQELIDLAIRTNTSVLFDIKFDDEQQCGDDHPYRHTASQIIVDIINNTTFPASKMWWLYYDRINITTSYSPVGTSLKFSREEYVQQGVRRVNLGFGAFNSDDVRLYGAYNVSFNVYVVDSPWLYSLFWCMGVGSITTNKCQLFEALRHPVWHLTPAEFLAMWLTIDIVSILIIIIMLFGKRLQQWNQQRGAT